MAMTVPTNILVVRSIRHINQLHHRYMNFQSAKGCGRSASWRLRYGSEQRTYGGGDDFIVWPVLLRVVFRANLIVRPFFCILSRASRSAITIPRTVFLETCVPRNFCLQQ